MTELLKLNKNTLPPPTESLLRFAKIAKLTYEDPDIAKAHFKEIDCEIVKFFDVDDAQAYLLKQYGAYILSFRGTSSKSDVLADIDAGKTFEIDKVSGVSVGKVHHGFKQELDKLWPEIYSHTSNISSLYVTGHSLGAAMATLAARRLYNKVLTVITFGSPRVGTQEFVNNCLFDHYRVQNNCDDVTKVPLLIMGFRHHGTHVYLDVNGKIRKFNIWQIIKDMIRSRIISRLKRKRFIGLTDHFMDNYISKLSKNVN